MTNKEWCFQLLFSWKFNDWSSLFNRNYIVTISLVCQEEQLIQRLQKDIEHHRRQPDSIPNSLARIANYKELNTIKVDVSDLTPLEAAKAIEQVVVGMVPKSNS